MWTSVNPLKFGFSPGETVCWFVQQQWSLCSAGMCTIEGNTGTIPATGTTPLTATTGRSSMCQAIHRHYYSGQPALLNWRYTGAAALLYVEW